MKLIDLSIKTFVNRRQTLGDDIFAPLAIASCISTSEYVQYIFFVRDSCFIPGYCRDEPIPASHNENWRYES